MKKFKLVSLALALVMLMSSASTTTVFAATTDFSVSNESVETLSAAAGWGIGRWYLGEVTFTDSNGGSYKNITAGSKMRICVAFKPVDGKQYSPFLWIYCYQYGGKKMYQMYREFGTVATDPDGYCYYVSDWFNITPNTDYRLYYETGTVGGDNGSRRISAHVWYDIQ